MNLTTKQSQRIAKYLRDIDIQLASLSQKSRENALSGLRSRLESELGQFTSKDPDDRDIEAILASCGTPGRVAAEVLGKHTGMERLALSPERLWLGVCAGIARRLDADVRIVRLLAVLGGLITGPLAMALYLGLYFHLYLDANDDAVPAIQRARLLRMTLGTIFGIVGLFVAARLLEVLAFTLYTRFTTHTVASIGQCLWLDWEGAALLFWAMVLLLPWAVLAGLPLSEGWGSTVKKVVQAGIALYASALCFGLASILTGIIIQLAKDFAM